MELLLTPPAMPPRSRAWMQPMTEWKLKMAVSAIIDLADLTVGMMPVVGHGKELIMIPAALGLWGWRGAFYGWELLEMTNIIDGLIPTALAIGWSKRAEYQQRQREWDAEQACAAAPMPAPAE